MFEVDLVGGPEDGHTYAFSDLPPFLYFPYLPEPVGLLPGETEDMPVPLFETPKLVYKRVFNNLYLYQGITE